MLIRNELALIFCIIVLSWFEKSINTFSPFTLKDCVLFIWYQWYSILFRAWQIQWYKFYFLTWVPFEFPIKSSSSCISISTNFYSTCEVSDFTSYSFQILQKNFLFQLGPEKNIASIRNILGNFQLNFQNRHSKLSSPLIYWCENRSQWLKKWKHKTSATRHKFLEFFYDFLDLMIIATLISSIFRIRTEKITASLHFTTNYIKKKLKKKFHASMQKIAQASVRKQKTLNNHDNSNNKQI